MRSWIRIDPQNFSLPGNPGLTWFARRLHKFDYIQQLIVQRNIYIVQSHVDASLPPTDPQYNKNTYPLVLDTGGVDTFTYLNDNGWIPITFDRPMKGKKAAN